MTALDLSTQMPLPKQCVRVVVPHTVLDTGDADLDAYHQWVTLGERVKADIRGFGNPRMVEANWTRWVCNNGDCYGIAFIHDDLARLALIAAAERTTA